MSKQQPLPSKDYDFAKTLCHFNRTCSGEDFFAMIEQMDLQDLKNQYLDSLNHRPDKAALIDSYHILLHIAIIQKDQELQTAQTLDSLLSESGFALEKICTKSFLGFSFVKQAAGKEQKEQVSLLEQASHFYQQVSVLIR
jgi:hypothetical protein